MHKYNEVCEKIEYIFYNYSLPLTAFLCLIIN